MNTDDDVVKTFEVPFTVTLKVSAENWQEAIEKANRFIDTLKTLQGSKLQFHPAQPIGIIQIGNAEHAMEHDAKPR